MYTFRVGKGLKVVEIKHLVGTELMELEKFAIPMPAPMGLRSIVKPPSNKVVQVNTKAPMPFLRVGAPSNSFKQLKFAVSLGAGFDFLATCADVMRDRNFSSNKPGVAFRSRHKCGDAIDFNQADKSLIIVSEPQGIQQFFRTWLKCAKQDGSQGVKTTLHDIRGYVVSGWYFDFTNCATKFGWKRIPAWKGWSIHGSGYTKMEFWHYELTEGLSFDEAMTFLYGNVDNIKDARKPNYYRVLGLNDRGAAVRNLQEKLSKLVNPNTKHFYLDRQEIDGTYGRYTQLAVKLFQENNDLDPDGLFGQNTRQLLDILTKKA